MIYLSRPSIPAHLSKHAEEWLKRFLEKRKANPSNRPSSSQYGHEKIRKVLNGMSHTKCFYCEALLKDRQQEVEHYIEVSVDPSKAFDWNNLYLSCVNCNDKINHNEISVFETLDPCKHSDDEIRNHIYFVEESIYPVGNSEIGDKTIRKFRLDSDKHDNLRRKHLIRVYRDLFKIRENQRKENRKEFTQEERRLLERYVSPLAPYSMMIQQFFIQKGIIL